MNLKEGIEKLGNLIAGFNKVDEPIVTTEQNFVDAKLNDGVTIVRYDADVLATGVVVSILDETGAALPLPVGDYILEDGTTFTVVDDLGTIDNVVLAPEKEEGEENTGEVVAPAPATEVPMSDKPAMGTPKRVIKSQVEEHVFSIETDNEIIEVDLSSMFKKLEDENKALKDLNKQMFSVISQMSELPASAPTETKQKFSAAKAKQDYLASMEVLTEQMSKENTY
jgi:hypothetical protein